MFVRVQVCVVACVRVQGCIQMYVSMCTQARGGGSGIVPQALSTFGF